MLNKRRNIIIILTLFLIILSIPFFKNIKSFNSETLDFSNYMIENTTEITGEITKDCIIEQRFKNYLPNLESIDIRIGNFDNRYNNGNLHIEVLCDDVILSNNTYNISTLKDGQYLNIPLNKNFDTRNKEIIIKIFSNDCESGSSITLWMSENKIANGNILVNNISKNKILDMKLNYYSFKGIYIVYFILILLLFIMIPLDIYSLIYNKYLVNKNFNEKVKNYKTYFFLLIFAFFIICLRNLNFITEPMIYAEDGGYIANILNHGLLNSIFTTRGGGTADFQNSGSYILLYVSLMINKLINGYNLSYLPTYIGIVSNMFLSIVAVVIYIALKPNGKYMALVSYLGCILMPMGNYSGEILGRTLNTVFIWPVLTSMLLIILYRSKYNNIILNIVVGMLCILAGLSFPVSYGIVGVYLLYTLFLHILNKENLIKWIKNNFILLINIIIGIYFLPSMIKSEGITSDMIMNPNSIIEFSIARHILYPFISCIYRALNDKVVLVIFVLYMMIVVYTIYLNVKKSNFENSYFLIAIFTFMYCLASVIMRIKMTELFSEYQSTFPDRYFYACNLLSFILLLYSVSVILENINIKYTIKNTIKSIFIIVLLINPNIFKLAESDIHLIGDHNFGTLRECINVSNDFNEEKGTFTVPIHPKGWEIELPYIYVISTK